MLAKHQVNRWASLLWKILFVGIALYVVGYLFRHYLSRPGEVMADMGGDTAKNYYTVLWQALYGKGIWFEGMNYPYGEHSSFVDGQPLLSVSLSYLREWMPLSVEDVLATMHLLIVFSYVLGAIYTYKILRLFQLPQVASGLFALLITCMSPQVIRAYGHFGLSYGCILPMLFYWLLQYQYSGKLKYTIYIWLLGCAASFLHPYWAGICAVWCGLYVLCYLLLQRLSWRGKLKHVGILLGAAAGIILMVQLSMRFTDPVEDRPTEPVGFFRYTADTKDIITSPASPFWSRLSASKVVTDISTFGEGYAYVGMAALQILLAWAVVALVRYRKSKPHPPEAGYRSLSWIWVAVALLALMLGSGAPFTWGMEGLLEYMPAFRQFRSLGRFTWIFYYITVVYAAVCCWRLYVLANGSEKKTVSFIVLLFPTLLWLYEAKAMVEFFRLRSFNMPWNKQEFFGEAGHENWAQMLAANGYKPSDFQAVMALPFFHIGSDKISLQTRHSGWVAGLASRASINLQLPMMNMLSARSSWSQTFDQVRMVAGPYAIKPILNLLSNDKPILTLVFKADSLSRDDKYLLQSATYIGEILDCQLYALYPERLRRQDSLLWQQARQIAATMHARDTCIGANGNTWAVVHYDEQASPQTLWGPGALTLHDEWTDLIQLPIRPVGDTVYEVSAWVQVNNHNADAPVLKIFMIDSVGTEWEAFDYNVSQATDFKGFWFRISAYVPLRTNCRILKCCLQFSNVAYRLDELMLRPASATIISRIPGKKEILVNNHLLTMP